jgi:nucleoside-diphosphate-sugar epimerase
MVTCYHTAIPTSKTQISIGTQTGGDVAASLRRVLVTGGAGQIGRAVLDLLAAEGIAATALVLGDTGDLPAATVVVGDAGDPDVAARAVTGADAVIHLAAHPSPLGATAKEVFCGNTRATFAVLEAAGRQGIRRAAIASSYAIAGLTFATGPVRPAYLPFDAAIPLQISDPYALSKQTDEATAAMMARRHGMSVPALRLPLVSDAAVGLPKVAARYAENPAAGAGDVWSYLDVRDAARAFLLAIRVAPAGAPVLYAAAPETLMRQPTEELIDAYLPDVPRRTTFAGRAVPIDLAPARAVLGFTARHIFAPQ